MIELTFDEKEAVDALSMQWQETAEKLTEWQFDYDEFRALAKNTYGWLEKFFLADSFPHEIVALLLSVKEFACNLCSVSPEADAAQLLAETLCDVENLFGIEGENYECYPDGKRELYLEIYDHAEEDFHKILIDTETFDLTPIVEIMKK